MAPEASERGSLVASARIAAKRVWLCPTPGRHRSCLHVGHVGCVLPVQGTQRGAL